MKDTVATAYRELADLLATLRRIIGRWMERSNGDGSFDDLCPPSVAERLLDRRAEEAALCRVPAESESLLEYTTFTDLSELLIDNLELIDRLVPRLVSSPEKLISRLAELEVIRLQLARAKPVMESEIEAVREFHDRLLTTLKKPPAKKARTEQPPAGVVAEPSPSSPAPPAPDADMTVADLFGVDEALAVDDDVGVMRALHQEVTILADQAISGRLERPALVWSILAKSGWLGRNLERLQLEPVEQFQGVIDELRVHLIDGANGDELRRVREEKAFTSLLLKMRETFLKPQV